MTRQVTIRDQRHDPVKILIGMAATGSSIDELASNPAVKGWVDGRWGQAGTPGPVDHLVGKAAVSATTASNLGNVNNLQDIALLKSVQEQSVLFRLRGLVRTGFLTRTITASGSIGSWVGENHPIPAQRVTVLNAGLEQLKVATLATATREALDTVPGIEAAIFAELAGGLVDRIDRTLLSADAAVAGVSPAGLGFGITPIAGTADPSTDIAAALGTFAGDLTTSYLVCGPAAALRLAGDLGLDGDIGARGGEVAGLPTLVSRNCAPGLAFLIDPGGLQAAYDDAALLETAGEAAIELNDAPGDPPSAASIMTSLWQINAFSFRAILYIAWRIARPGSVAVISGGWAA